MMSPVKCLLVDDLPENLLALSAVLQRDDVDILTARSGTEALELMLEHDFALAFLDVQMPEMDGFELAELIRGSERTRHVPLIFVTAGTRDQNRMFKGYESGAVDFLYKPIEPHVARSKSEIFFELYRQRQLLAQQLQERTETLRLNEMFSAVLGHDLRNPLSAIVTAAHLVQYRSEDPVIKAAAGRILAGGKWMSRLITDMLDFARARLAGGIPLKFQPGDLGELARRVIAEHFQETAAGRIELQADGELKGEWDADRLIQVISNLVGNALQHGTPDTTIQVALLAPQPGQARLEVRNAGTIDPQLLPHVFDPFRGGVDCDPRAGLGLGLYIAKEIVERHGGRLEVHVDGDTHTVFCMTLPCERKAP
jgi:two-component system sensor histidine kinase/response regulator